MYRYPGYAALVLLLSWTSALFVVPSAHADEPDCLECHGDLVLATEGVRVFDRAELEAGVHAGLGCTDCHEAAEKDGFAVVPHRMAEGGPPACIDCHDDDFSEIEREYHASVHAKDLKAFGCATCHDPHTLRTDLAALPREERVAYSNRSCLRCHRDSVYRVVGRHDGHAPSTAHDWLPSLDKHLRMRCIVCHTPIEGKDIHQILPKADATRSCEACHETGAPLVRKYVGEDDRSSWVTNPLIFEQAYVPGATRNRLADTILVALFALAVAGVLGHGLLRIVTGLGRKDPPFVVERKYLYWRSERIWHWSNALLFVILAVTGLRMHFGGRDAPLLSFETAFNVHNLAGVVFVLVTIFFHATSVITGRWRHYLSRPRDGLHGVFVQARWYLLGIFQGKPHPYHADEQRKFNPLQQVVYAGLMFLVLPLLVASGLVLLYPGVMPARLWGHPGPWWIATAHYLLGCAGVLFLIGHLYLGTTGDRIGYLLSGMITGWHRDHRPHDGRGPCVETQGRPTRG